MKKGNTGDYRVVYNGSASGLNKVVWAPWFPLPTISSHLRMVEEVTYMADSNIGDMFLNFMLHPSLQQYYGVDVTLFSGRNRGEGEIEYHTSREGVKNKSRTFHIGGECVVPEQSRVEPKGTSRVRRPGPCPTPAPKRHQTTAAFVTEACPERKKSAKSSVPREACPTAPKVGIKRRQDHSSTADDVDS